MIFQTSRNVKRFLYQQRNSGIYIKWIQLTTKNFYKNVNQKFLSVTEVNQWKNSHSVIEWFKNIRNKSNASFFVFDIESFYHSISLKLLEDAINFAKTVCNISERDTSINMQARRTLFFNNGDH